MSYTTELDNQAFPPEPYVEFSFSSCQECGEFGPAFLRKQYKTKQEAQEESDPEILAGSLWDIQHRRSTGHGSFYSWNISRANARIY